MTGLFDKTTSGPYKPTLATARRGTKQEWAKMFTAKAEQTSKPWEQLDQEKNLRMEETTLQDKDTSGEEQHGKARVAVCSECNKSIS